MTIYPDELTDAQRNWINNYESTTTHNAFYLADYLNEQLTWDEMVKKQIEHFDAWASDALNDIMNYGKE